MKFSFEKDGNHVTWQIMQFSNNKVRRIYQPTYPTPTHTHTHTKHRRKHISISNFSFSCWMKKKEEIYSFILRRKHGIVEKMSQRNMKQFFTSHFPFLHEKWAFHSSICRFFCLFFLFCYVMLPFSCFIIVSYWIYLPWEGRRDGSGGVGVRGTRKMCGWE